MALKIMVDFQTDGATMEDLYLAKGVLKLIDQGYQEDGVETPEWVIDKINAINGETSMRNRAEIQRRLKAAKARRSAMATLDEKRKAADDEIAALEAKIKG
jgi:hypothetical protein